jgi:hypothetical protein
MKPIFVESGDATICAMAAFLDPTSHIDPKEATANARLIAAAPNLLSAAKRMLEAVQSDDPAEPGTQRPDSGAVMSLKGAVAKAEGKA